MKEFREFFARSIPTGSPVLIKREPETDGVNFLSHKINLSFSSPFSPPWFVLFQYSYSPDLWAHFCSLTGQWMVCVAWSLPLLPPPLPIPAKRDQRRLGRPSAYHQIRHRPRG